MKFKIILFSVGFFIATNTISGQLKRIDSIYLRLQDSIKHSKDYITTFKLYDYYSILLEHDKKFNKSQKNYYDILKFVDKHFQGFENDSLSAITYLNLSFLHFTKNNLDSTILFTNKVIDLTKKNDLMSLLVKAYSNQVNAYVNNERYELAIDKSFELRDKISKVQDSVPRNAMDQSNFLNLGFIYIKMRNWDEAEKYLNKSVEKPNTNPNLKARSYLNLSAIYLETKRPKLALRTAKIADSIIRTAQFYPYDFINIQINIASSHSKLKNFKEALITSDEILKIANDLKFNEGIAQGSLLKGEALAELKQYKTSLKFLNSGYEMADKLSNYELKRDAAENLAELYARINNFNKAYKYKEVYQKLSDSLNLIQKNKDVSDALAKYKTIEKEKQIAEQDLELQTQKATIADQRNTQLILLAGLGFLILGGLLFYNRNKAKQKQALQEAVLEEKEKGFAAVIKASEDERKRISKDLHDGIGQEMAALKMAINHVKKSETDIEKKEALENIYNNCSKSADEIRNISHKMMPRTLLENGLVEAIEDLLKSTFNYSDIAYKFEHFEVAQRFDERIEISLYRVAQELINNVVKHANASEVNVMLYQQSNNLIFLLEDNGVGMQNTNKKGHGVLNIKSRIDMIKGTINYEPSPNSGTTATIKIPL